jgi:PTH1 family peptidyl-tRNA hydrolase
MKLVVGLGNPGKEYAGTRHNVGFEIVDALANSLETSFKSAKEFKAEIAEARSGSEKILLAKPTTYMNLSGDAVRAIASFYKIPTENILIIQDEMDYAVGDFAFTQENGPAGHNGIESIQQALGTKKIGRLRVGVGRPTVEAKEDYVLGRFSKEDLQKFGSISGDVQSALKDWVACGLTKAMNTWNGV